MRRRVRACHGHSAGHTEREKQNKRNWESKKMKVKEDDGKWGTHKSSSCICTGKYVIVVWIITVAQYQNQFGILNNLQKIFKYVERQMPR